MKSPFQLFIIFTVAGILTCFIYYYHKRDDNIPVDGFYHPSCKNVAHVFGELLRSRKTKGASVAVYYKGSRIINMWGGYADHEFRIPWKENSLAYAASVTKSMAAIGVALLVQRGKLKYSDPVYKFWPEFTSHGKDAITVEMLLSHQSGLIGMRPRIPADLIKNWVSKTDEIDTYLIKQKPAWIPGTACGYQARVHGLFVDALIRHVDDRNRTASQFFNEEIAIPFGIEFYIGLPKELFYRKVRGELQGLKWAWILEAFKSLHTFDIALNIFTNSKFKAAQDIMENASKLILSCNDPDTASIPFLSGLGFGTANSVAKLYSFLSTKNDILLRSDTISLVRKALVSGTDLTCGYKANYTRGFFAMKNILGEDVIGHTGFGGQLAIADIERDLFWAYLTNDYTAYVFGNDPNTASLEEALYGCLGDV